MYFRVIHVSPLSDIMKAELRDLYTIIGINVQIAEAVHVEFPTKLSERKGLRISVGELPRSILVAGDPVVGGQREQLVFPN